MPNLTLHSHPVLTVPCGDCHVAVGAWCKRPSGHHASDLHAARRDAADRALVVRHGPDAEISYDEDLGRWEVENADLCTLADP